MKNKRAVLFCNGEIRDLNFHKQLLLPDDLIVAVDGGGRYCKDLDLIPQLAIGDFDSLPSDIKTYFSELKTEIITYPADKDYIDTVLAIETVKNRGYDDILIFGALGGKRTDMCIANLLCISRFAGNITIINETTEVHFLRNHQNISLRSHIGDYCSLIPLTEQLYTGISSGLKYQLDGLVFRRGETRSISNEFTEAEAEISVIDGEALIIIERNS